MALNRREVLGAAGAAALGTCGSAGRGAEPAPVTDTTHPRDLRIQELRITPIALPDPPILAASGCHGPYFLRNIVELITDDGIVGIGETRGGEEVTRDLRRARAELRGQSAFAYRKFAAPVRELGNAVYAGIELACLDAIGRASGRRLCELLGGPVREEVEFASYLFYRYAADHPIVLADERLVDDRGQGEKALDQWGEVRTPEAMADMAWKFHRRWGFRFHKLKAGVLSPEVELESLRAMQARLGDGHLLRIDPNARWTVETALRIGHQLRDLPLDYYEDPVAGQEDMARVRRQTGLPMSTNMCVTRLEHIAEAIKVEPVDVVLGDHHGWGGITAFQTLGDMAEQLGWGLSQHSNNHGGLTMAAMIHVGAVVPQLTYASDTHYVWLPEGADIITGPNLPIREGKMSVPSGVGLGVELDRDKLARAHEIYQKCGMRDRDDAALMRKLSPGWQRNRF